MVTFAFIITFSFLFLLTGFIDMFLYKISWYESFYHLVKITPGTYKWMVYAGLLAGFLSSIRTDYQLFKKNRRQKKHQKKQAVEKS